MSRPFIVSTVRDPGPPLLSFVRYHRQLGFAGLILFFDDPADPWLPVARELPGVMAIACTPELKRKQQRLRCYPRMEPFLGELMGRQVVHAEHAIELARDAGADWLLHIDVDELFCAAESAPEHFGSLPADVGQVSYLNHEGAPEVAEMEDYFRTVTLFKLNPRLLPQGAVDRWLAENRREWYFLAYGNGKAAVRLAPGAEARGPHQFEPSPDCPRSIQIGYPCILHYANCGFEWYYQKYRLRRAFPDRYFDQQPRIPFHLRSRDLFLAGDPGAMRDFYRQQVMFAEPTVVQSLLERGLGMRIAEPRSLLEAP